MKFDMATAKKFEQHLVNVECSCGNSFELYFNLNMPKSISIEKCSKCHPAYNDSVVDTSNSRDKKVKEFNKKCDFSSLFDD